MYRAIGVLYIDIELLEHRDRGERGGLEEYYAIRIKGCCPQFMSSKDRCSSSFNIAGRLRRLVLL